MSTGSPHKDPPKPLTTARIEDSLVEPARRGLRHFGAGAGRAVGALALLFGVGFLAAGGLMAALGGAVVYNIGVVVLALGVLTSLFGGGSLYFAGQVVKEGDRQEIERRLVRMLTERDLVTDEDAAKRMRLDVRAVRAVADDLVRRGRVTVDVHPESGADIYALIDDGEAPLLASAEERRSLEDFSARVAAAAEADRSAASGSLADDDQASDQPVESAVEVVAESVETESR